MRRELKYGLFGSQLLGDALMQTPAIRALKAAQPDAQIEYHRSGRPAGRRDAGDARDPRYAEWQGERAYGLPIRDVAALLAASHAVLSVDTGIRHLAAAVGANLYCVSGAVPLSLIKCVPVRERQRIYEVAIAVSDVDARVLVDGASKVL